MHAQLTTCPDGRRGNSKRSIAGKDRARREYWIEQMEMGFHFMQSIMGYPVAECGEQLVSLRESAEEARVEVCFSNTQIVDGLDRRFYLREGLTGRFLAVTKEMNERGLVLKVEDAFRDRQMQKQLALKPGVFDKVLAKVIWENNGEMPTVGRVVHRLSALIASCPKTGTHMSGSAIDISVLNRDSREELDRGGPYLEMSERTPMASPFVDDGARRNRETITALMRKHGFIEYPCEFWHYSSGDAMAECVLCSGKPGRYGPVDADIRLGAVVPIPDPASPLNSEDEMKAMIKRAMERLD